MDTIVAAATMPIIRITTCRFATAFNDQLGVQGNQVY